MNLSVGTVGLPNVGKSTLFNALLEKNRGIPTLLAQGVMRFASNSKDF